ncbi:MAG TPA: hypothetical protein ENN41_09040 [Sediminispirochaeta sp.]|nr:hypothetical protein [Sediminispirochaeta sp.]
MKRFAAFLFVLSVAFSLSADVESWKSMVVDLAWYPPNLEGYGTDGFAPIDFSTVEAAELQQVVGDAGRDLGGSGYEGRVSANYFLRLPMMRGDSPLTEENNMLLQLRAELSPISIAGELRSVLTPLAVLKIENSLFLGSGWSIGELHGLSLNTKEDPFAATPLGGLFLSYRAAATLQFDWAALFPGDWHHVVMVYNPSLQYRLYTGAASDEPWQWQADGGENYNGWYWGQNAVLAYQTPALELLNTAGLLLETRQRITRRQDSPMDEGGWGSDFMEIYIAPILVLDLGESQGLTLQFQFARGRNYTDESIGNESFLNRQVMEEDPTYWYFRRIALSYALEL